MHSLSLFINWANTKQHLDSCLCLSDQCKSILLSSVLVSANSLGTNIINNKNICCAQTSIVTYTDFLTYNLITIIDLIRNKGFMNMLDHVVTALGHYVIYTCINTYVCKHKNWYLYTEFSVCYCALGLLRDTVILYSLSVFGRLSFDLWMPLALSSLSPWDRGIDW